MTLTAWITSLAMVSTVTLLQRKGTSGGTDSR